MTAAIHTLLQTLCMAPAPSGFENAAAAVVKEQLLAVCDTVETDMLGNVCGRIRGTVPSLKPIMLCAHMDRVGFILSQITDDGFLKFHMIGGIPEKALPGQQLLVQLADQSDWRAAVVGNPCEHLMSESERRSVVPLSGLYADVGAKTAAQARAMGFEIGCPAVYTPSFTVLDGTRVAATALDNCACLCALISIAKKISQCRPPRDVLFAGTVMEEFHQRSTAGIIEKYQPAVLLSMDVLLASDTPDGGAFEGSLGAGPSLSYFNYCDGPFNGTIGHRGLLRLVEKTAVESDISVQRFVCSNSLGDAAYAQLAGGCPATIELGIPVRYAHSPREVADTQDLEALIRLICALLHEIDGEFQQARI